MRVNISIDDSLLNRVDAYAKSRNMSRSALLAASVTQYIEAQEALPDIQGQIKELFDALEALKDKDK